MQSPFRFSVGLVAGSTVLAVWNTGCMPAHAQDSITLTNPQTAGMSMFRAHWDKPLPLAEDGPVKVKDTVIKDRGGSAEWGGASPGPLAFDALNRSLLVRFPDAAEKIAAALKAGKSIQKVELVLPFKDEELWPVGNADYVGPDGYCYRTNWGTDALYRAQRPQWHAVAWALRRAWASDGTYGPTFNAAVNGKVFWSKYGAADTNTDRFAPRFGPAEVSYKAPEGRLDVTATLSDPAFGKTLAARLRTLADCGFLIQKEETYDAKYFTGAYEWSTATGPRAIMVKSPTLVVTFGAGKADLGGALPAAPDIAAAANGPAVGAPTAVLPTAEALTGLIAKYAQKPAWMEPWQWARVQELKGLEKPEKVDEPYWYQFVPDYLINRLREGYRDAKGAMAYRPARPELVFNLWVDQIIGRPLRGWSGFETAREMAQWHNYGATLPLPAQDAIKRYWTAWLMPDRKTAPTEAQRRDRLDTSGMLVHPMTDDPRVGGKDAVWPDPTNGRFDTYYSKTGDWRGNKSFFRSGFTRTQSTQNFNTTSSAGALLGGALIGSEYAMEDGRYGVELMPLREYCWTSGFGQEHIDHYYFAVTVAGNKALADYSPTTYDKLIGQSLLTKNIEELISAYHPGLRTLVGGSSRSALEFRLGMQDGLQHILHTLSPSGTERDLGVDTFATGHKRIGHDLYPDQVARQSLAQPWAPNWVVPMVDDKPLPYEVSATGWQNSFSRTYLGAHYGLATTEANEKRFQAAADWRREAKQAANTSELATLDIRYGKDKTLWMNDGQGRLNQPGSLSLLQHKNKVIALTSPNGAPSAKRLQSSIGLFTLQTTPTWEVFVDGKKVEALPFTCKQGQKITIHDGVTYLGIIPLPATDLGRDAEVTIEAGEPQKGDLDFYRSRIAASLEINSFNYNADAPITDDDKKKAAAKAYGGFTLEMGDATEYGSFEKFQQHFAGAKAEVSFDAATNVVSAKYSSGKDVLEASSKTAKEDGSEVPANLITHLANGADTHLPAGLELDTPYGQQGYGKLTKNGATLEGETNRRIFLLTEPKGGIYCAWNPLPDLNAIKFTLPGGGTVSSNGKAGLCRLTYDQKQNKLSIEHAYKPGQEKADGAAQNFVLTGFAKLPKVEVNGQPQSPAPNRGTTDGKAAWSVPVGG